MGPELWIVLGVVALVLGPTQLPKLARSIGSAKRELQDAADEKKHDETPPPPAPPSSNNPPPTS